MRGTFLVLAIHTGMRVREQPAVLCNSLQGKDDWDKKLDMVTPAWRVAIGFLIRKNFFPMGGRDAMMKVTSDPLEGWDIDEVAQADNGGAQNDIHGKLFYHVRDQFKLFVSRLRTLKADIEVRCNDAKALPAALSGTKFDRIVISKMTDDPVWDTQRMLQILSPMLKDKSVNRHARVLEEKTLARGGAYEQGRH
ncbi:hypothetical protein F5B21DRAFT_521811 [Xylaria acuta]|nr:hypothetical protein F5B21DRAFT_521811 [Xylaria acuta]